MDKELGMYRGKPIEDMTKEELQKAIVELGKMLQDTHIEHIRQLEVLSDVRKTTKS